MTGELVDVLVVGAGPTGLTLAAELAASGVRARLIDRGLDRVHESRALAIQPRTLEVLADLGVTDELIATGNRAVQLRMHVPGRVLIVPMFDLGLDDTAYPFLLFLSQAETERVLGEYLAAVAARRCCPPATWPAAMAGTAASAAWPGSGSRAAPIRRPSSWPIPRPTALNPARRMSLSPRRGWCSFSRSSRRPRGGCWPCGHRPTARHPMHRSSSTRFRPSPAPTPAAPCGCTIRCG